MAEQDIDENNCLREDDNSVEQCDEVLALESIFADTGRFHIENSRENDELYSLCIKVLVSEISEDGIVVNAWVPCTDSDSASGFSESITQSGLPPGKRPVFLRSHSGNHWHSSFTVFHLTPLTLHVTFPPYYPYSGPPIFTLSCLWLNANQVSCLCRQLDSLWEESAGMPIIFTWVDWLENNTISFLGLERSVILEPHVSTRWQHESAADTASITVDAGIECESSAEDGACASYKQQSERDPRALPECCEVEEALLEILRVNRDKEMEDFNQSTQECGICFEEKTGQHFFKIEECDHHFCHVCVADYVEMHVADGTVQHLMCLSQECKVGLPPAVIRTVLGEEAFSRWERLLLQKALETMGDVMWCPRCNQPVITEEQAELNLAHCTNCVYSFCTQCSEAWHSGSKCSGIEEKLEDLRKKSKNSIREQVDLNIDAEMRRRKRLMQEYLSVSTVKSTSKPCPKCKVRITKHFGCNLVTCSMCSTKMCWVCGNAIKGYDHFGRCTLFATDNYQEVGQPVRQRPEEAERIEQHILLNPNAKIKRCPNCRQRNLKENRNNHIRCWSCKVSICYICQNKITGLVTAHFKPPNTCVQHSDD